MEAVTIWIRKTADWRSEQAFRQQLPAHLEAAVATWDATFRLSFREFRAELRAIAAENLAAVEGARVTTEWDRIPEGAVVLPVDDDDWFAPHAATAVAAGFEAGPAVCRWPARWLQVPLDLGHLVHRILRRAGIPDWTEPVCATNNYALRKSPASQGLLGWHPDASAWYRGLEPDRIVGLPAGLSLANRSLASITTLTFKGRRPTPAWLRRCARLHELRYRVGLPSELAWARPCLERMRALMRRLR